MGKGDIGPTSEDYKLIKVTYQSSCHFHCDFWSPLTLYSTHACELNRKWTAQRIGDVYRTVCSPFNRFKEGKEKYPSDFRLDILDSNTRFE